MPNKIKTNPETPIIFQPSGNPLPTGAGFTSGTIVHFVADSIGSGVGRISNQYDLGVGPRTTLFEWRGTAVVNSGAAIGTTVDSYFSTSNSVCKDGALSVTEGSLTNENKKKNLQFCGSMVVDSSGNPDPAQSSGLIEIFGRYISLVWWNNTNISLGTGNYLILTPVPDEIQ